MLNNEQKALLNKKEAFKGHKQQGNSTFRNIKKKKILATQVACNAGVFSRRANVLLAKAPC